MTNDLFGGTESNRTTANDAARLLPAIPPLLTLLAPVPRPQVAWGKVFCRKLLCSKVATAAAGGRRTRSRMVGSVGMVDVVVSAEAAAFEWPQAEAEVVFLRLII